MENKLTPELLEKAKQAESFEELIALAKETSTELTEESAKAYFDQLHKTGELAEDELGNVSGGSCYNSDGREIVTVGHCCTLFWCKKCGSEGILETAFYSVCKQCGYSSMCDHCKYCTYEKGLWLCNRKRKK